MKKKPYFVIKVPIFPANIHIVFNEPAFRQMLKDKNVPQKIEYLENGAMAETHSIPTADGRTVIALILDLKAIDNLDSTLVHESVHLVYRIFEYICEETPGEECRAYLTEYIYNEIKKVTNEPAVRKAGRKILSDTSEKVLGALLEMAVDHHGGTGQNSDLKSKDPVRGTEDEERTGFKKTRSRIQTAK